ncbi:MAG: ATP-binding cassette domain-containing protein [Micrococcales bacterium]|nr:ATP-binding cassette domain-containing protein [Micrococcales bacterium]
MRDVRGRSVPGRRRGDGAPDSAPTTETPHQAPAGPVLDARLVARRGALDLDVPLRVAAGEVVALVGPNASGKSTVLQLVAGLLSSRDGWVVLRGTTHAGRPPDRAGRPVRPTAPYRRGIGYLGQDPHVFGHLSVRRNVAYGVTGPRARRRARTDALLDELDLVALADRRADQLSGGEQARVALARALAADPHLLLLDEPLAALDVRAAAGIRTRLAAALAQRRLPAVLVTHDVLDVAALAERVIVLDRGQVADAGPVAGVLGQPRTPFAAALAAVSLVAGSVVDDRFVAESGWQLPLPPRNDPQAAPPPSDSPTAPDRPTGQVWLAVPSDALSLRPAPGGASLRATAGPEAPWPDRTPDAWTWDTTVTGLQETSDGLRAEVAACPGLAAPVARAWVVDRIVAPDARVRVRVDLDRVRVYARTPG